MDTQARHALKNDKFAQATATSMDWVTEHRSKAVQLIIVAVVVLALVIGGAIFWTMRNDAADLALGAALDTYDSPLQQPGVPPEPNTYATAAERAAAANKQFAAVVQKYGMLSAGSKAHYFAGITDQQMGQTGPAETELKAAAGAMDRNLSNLAKLALAGLYHQTQRDPQAVDLYNQIAAKPSDTVPTNVAKLDLADLYVATGKLDQARALWAQVKDADKDGAAGSIATQKLTGGK